MKFYTTILAQVLAANEVKMQTPNGLPPAKIPAKALFSANLTGVTQLKTENYSPSAIR